MVVPAGTVCPKVSVKLVLAAFIKAEFVLFGTVPTVNIAPVVLAGFAPPIALNPFPFIVVAKVSIYVAFNTTLVIAPVIVTLAVPEAFKVTV